ncbi:LD-carboxypeptidase [Amycolatopsis sp. BJA-103]|uniref:S66 peptidase family protein n=1 Tax=Amycolatopsis sp. BJA-103 TaxID=1911175 RepID=UPI000C7849C7|nr:LD-carboxypeptidase [Amycolatopsis sp. BJA-103]AUI58848.1 LD-carboxypeptidase [Amycolatopsis sp. BJA-103]PNE17701.1 LD-carboxypeptidase [Amycolatopsis sp. BJA-103]
MKPPKTRPGDTIALVAPAGPVPPELVEKTLPVLHGWGVEVRVGECVRAAPTGYLSAPDEARAAEFTEAWLDPGVTCVLAARGGYGSQRMLDLVDWAALRAAGPKMFAGSSDVTALHRAVNVHLGLETLFSPLPATTLFDDVAAEHLRLSLFEPDEVRTITSPTGSPLVPGAATGTLIGGNLALLASGLGAPEQGSARDAIVLLEDVTESAYRIDRMLTQLLRSGWFDGVQGIVLGSWAACGDPGAIRDLMLDRLGPLDVPTVWDFGFGHVPASPTIPLGTRATLDADAGTLVVLP